MKIDSYLLKQKLKYISYAIAEDIAARPITRVVSLITIDGVLYAYANNNINSVKVTLGDCDTNICLSVDFKTFNKFISSYTGEVTLKANNKTLEVKNPMAKCKIPIFDTSIDALNIPEFEKVNYLYYVHSENIHYNRMKSVLDKSLVIDEYQDIYFGKSIMVSDTNNVMIIKNTIFNERKPPFNRAPDILLDGSSVELLQTMSNGKAHIGNNYMYLKSDEFYAKVKLNNKDNFQYYDLMELFSTIDGDYVSIDVDSLTKSLTVSQLFNSKAYMVFSKDGVFIQTNTKTFVHQLSNTPCSDKTIEIDSKICKIIKDTYNVDINTNEIPYEFKLYYTNNDLIKCVCGKISSIISVTEVKDED